VVRHIRLHASTRPILVLSLLFAAIIVTPFELVQPAVGSTKSSVQACIGTNLIGAFAYSNVFAGGALITVAVVNVGPSACRLGGYPKLMGIRGGHEYAFTGVRHGTQDVSLRPAILAPRPSGALILDTELGCNANVAPTPAAGKYTGVVIVLPGGKGHVRIDGAPLYVPCGLGESELGWAKGFVFN
jgi:hypothetical protein